MLNEDYRDMLRVLLGNEVRFLVVGAYALGAYGYPRATGDFEIWVDASPANSKKIYASEDLIKNKLSTGRERDKLDAEHLLKNHDA